MKDLLLSGFIGYNYAQLIHLDNNDHGPTVVARITIWELDRLSCTDRWARDRLMQNAFKHMYDVFRTKEEVIILLSQSQRHINWYITKIRNITKALAELNTKNSKLGCCLLDRAQLATVTLQLWRKFQDVIDTVRTHDICEAALLVGLEGSISLAFALADL